jgi:hypothetical protein
LGRRGNHSFNNRHKDGDLDGDLDGDERATMMDWFPFPEELFLDMASHWDVATFLIEKKQVCREWNHLCSNAIDAKQT